MILSESAQAVGHRPTFISFNSVCPSRHSILRNKTKKNSNFYLNSLNINYQLQQNVFRFCKVTDAQLQINKLALQFVLAGMRNVFFFL